MGARSPPDSPCEVILTPEEVRFALAEQVDLLVDTVLGCLAEAPPELAQDIIYEGIHLLGGGARLRGLAERLAQETEVPVHLVADPLGVRRPRGRTVPRLVRQPAPDLRGRRVLTRDVSGSADGAPTRHSTASRSSAT